jgi:hypothetical protein
VIPCSAYLKADAGSDGNVPVDLWRASEVVLVALESKARGIVCAKDHLRLTLDTSCKTESSHTIVLLLSILHETHRIAELHSPLCPVRLSLLHLFT